jgi:hypothetical protein
VGAPLASNFAFLEAHDRGLVLLGEAAERAFHQDPVATIVHLRRFGEALARAASAHAGFLSDAREDQVERLRRLRDAGLLTREVADLFHTLRKAGQALISSTASFSPDQRFLTMFLMFAEWISWTGGSSKSNCVAHLLRSRKRYERASLRGGRRLLGIIRATKVAVVPAALDGANITQGTVRLRPSSIIATDFLAASRFAMGAEYAACDVSWNRTCLD